MSHYDVVEVADPHRRQFPPAPTKDDQLRYLSTLCDEVIALAIDVKGQLARGLPPQALVFDAALRRLRSQIPREASGGAADIGGGPEHRAIRGA